MALRWRPAPTLGHVLAADDRRRVAVLRVEVRDEATNGLLIELLEVGRVAGADRLVGSATTARGICRVIERWLAEMQPPPAAGLGVDR